MNKARKALIAAAAVLALGGSAASADHDDDGHERILKRLDRLVELTAAQEAELAEIFAERRERGVDLLKEAASACRS